MAILGFLVFTLGFRAKVGTGEGTYNAMVVSPTEVVPADASGDGTQEAALAFLRIVRISRVAVVAVRVAPVTGRGWTCRVLRSVFGDLEVFVKYDVPTLPPLPALAVVWVLLPVLFLPITSLPVLLLLLLRLAILLLVGVLILPVLRLALALVEASLLRRAAVTAAALLLLAIGLCVFRGRWRSVVLLRAVRCLAGTTLTDVILLWRVALLAIAALTV